MHDISSTLGSDVLQNTVGELRYDIYKVIFANVGVTCDNMHNFVIWLDLNFGWKTFGVGTCVGGAINAGMSQGRNKFTHVHVHSATITHTRLGKG
jgi:hypothetical protein